jgi:L-histidine N-alpha-methyltransferase
MNASLALRRAERLLTPFARDLIAGLRASPKRVPCKYFYDNEGSRLFEDICRLPEYYQTRTELALLEQHAGEIASLMGHHVELVEFGAGALRKVRILLDALDAPYAYTPIDISGDYLQSVGRDLAQRYPALRLRPIVADFTQSLTIPHHEFGAHRAGFFPGSTIGNFEPCEAVRLMRAMAAPLHGGGLLIGVDLVKDPAVLHAAYNDSAGVTAAFNKNLLARANRELGADFDIDAFDHYAFYNPALARIEMHLVSRRAQKARVAGEVFAFAEGEAIHTENSHKYTLESFATLARAAGLTARKVWSDSRRWFAIFWLVPSPTI